jgi:hypothetical protein
MGRTDDKVRENRVRRGLERQGFHLEKSRRRDPLAMDYDGYRVTDHRHNPVTGARFSMTLDEVERWGRTRGHLPAADGSMATEMVCDTVVSRALDLALPSAHAKLALIVLANSANKKGVCTGLSLRDMGRAMSLGNSTSAAAIKVLAGCGAISVERGSSGKPNVYTISPAVYSPCGVLRRRRSPRTVPASTS